MTVIRKAEDAPDDIGVISIGNEELDFGSGGTFETDSPVLIGGAQANPFLVVEPEEGEAETVAADYDPNDPHDNPEVDPLTVRGAPNFREDDEEDVAPATKDEEQAKQQRPFARRPEPETLTTDEEDTN